MTALAATASGETRAPILSKEEAERLTTRIGLRLDTIADNYVAVMPLIRQAIDGEAHKALGYASPGAYLAERFGDALGKLGVELRRDVVRELTEAGLSTRAIAPVVGTSFKTVARDLEPSPVSSDTPDELDQMFVHAQERFGFTPDLSPEARAEFAARPRPVVGLDGKNYKIRSKPKESRRPLPAAAKDAGWTLRKTLERIERILDDDRFARNKAEVLASVMPHLKYAGEITARLTEEDS